PNPTPTPIPSIAVLPPASPLTLYPPIPTASASSLLAPPGAHMQFSLLASEKPLVLPDDPPDPAHTKIGPIGQIILPSISSSANSKKKTAKKDGPSGEAGDGSPTKGKGSGSKKSAPKPQDKDDGNEPMPG